MSYRREDTAYPAGWLYDRLARHFGRSQVFKDIDSIVLGDDFVEVITAAVGSCDVLLALIGDRWLTVTGQDGRRRLDNPADFVRLEIEAALTRNVRVIPILVAGAQMPREDQLPASLAKLARRQALELSPSRFESDTRRLLRVLRKTITEAQEQARQEAEEEAARHRQQVKQLQQQIRDRAAAQDWDAVVAASGELAALDPAAADPDGLASTVREQIIRRKQAEERARQDVIDGPPESSSQVGEAACSTPPPEPDTDEVAPTNSASHVAVDPEPGTSGSGELRAPVATAPSGAALDSGTAQAGDEPDRLPEELGELVAHTYGPPSATSVLMADERARSGSGPGNDRALMGHDGQPIAEEVLHPVDEVLRDEAEKLDALKDKLTYRPKPSSGTDLREVYGEQSVLLPQIPSRASSVAQASSTARRRARRGIRMPRRRASIIGATTILLVAAVVIVFASINYEGRDSTQVRPPPTLRISPHLVRTLDGRVAGIDVAYSPNGETLVTANSYGGINLWNVATGRKTIAPLLEPYYDGTDQSDISVAYSPNGQTWAILGSNYVVSIWDAATKYISVSLDVHNCSDSPANIAYGPDGTTLVTACSSSAAKIDLWDVATGHIESVFDGPPGQDVYAVAYSPKGTTFVTADTSNDIFDITGNTSGKTYLWDVATRQIVATLTDPRSHGANDVAYSPNGKTVATADSNGDIYLWDAATGREMATLTSHCQGISAVSYSPDGTTLATVCGLGGNNVNLWDIATRHVVATLTDPDTQGVDAMVFNPNGTSLAVGDNNGNTYVWTYVSK